MKFVDFQRINDKKTRLILGATRVRDGSARWFDNAKEEIGPHHVMASGAIPPGFPGVRINNELYWDGGCYSNTPLAGMYDLLSDKDTLCFVLDLFGANGREPQNMAEVNLAVKDIEFSNRITRQINNVSDRHNFAHLLRHIVELHPNVLSNHPHRAELEKMMSDRRFDFMHVLYQKPTYEGAACDCEFSKTSISDRRQQGYSDMKKALGEQEQLITTQSAWRGPATQGSVVNTFAKGMCTGTSFLRGQMTRGNPKMPEPTEIPKPTSPQPRNKQKKRIPALV